MLGLLQEKKMDLIRFIAPFLLGIALVPAHAAEDTKLPRAQAAALVFECLNTGNCRAMRMLNVNDDKTSYYETTVKLEGMSFYYIKPMPGRRLDVEFHDDTYVITFVDTDVDGVVDYVIETSTEKNMMMIFGKEQKELHKRAQELYLATLHLAIRVFAIQQTAQKK